MALDGTYAGLQASVAGFLNRADLTAAVPDFIALAEAQISRRLLKDGPVRNLLGRSDATITGEFAAVPADFMGVRAFYMTSDRLRQLKFMEAEQIVEKKAQNSTKLQGDPRIFAVIGGEFQFYPAPADGSNFAAELTYWKRIPSLSNTVTTNWLLTLHPDAYLYGSLLQSAPYLMADERVPMWANWFETILSDIVEADKIERDAPFIAIPTVPSGTP